MLSQFCRENSNLVNIGKNIKHFTCDILLLLGETPLGKNMARIFGQGRTVTNKGLLLHRVRMECLSPVRAPPCISLRLICTNSRQATIVSPLKWNRLRLFHRHDQVVASARSSIHNRTFHFGGHASVSNENHPCAVDLRRKVSSCVRCSK